MWKKSNAASSVQGAQRQQDRTNIDVLERVVEDITDLFCPHTRREKGGVYFAVEK